VLADLVLSWDLLKPGGLVILEDYAWKNKEFPDELRPQVAVDAFITANRNYLAGFRVADYSSFVGKYEYLWLTGTLRSAETGQPVPLSDVGNRQRSGVNHRRPNQWRDTNWLLERYTTGTETVFQAGDARKLLVLHRVR